MKRVLQRLRTMNAAEIRWRSRALARTAAQRGISAIRPPAYRRAHLAGRLAPVAASGDVRRALDDGDWDTAHHALQRQIVDRAPRFVVAPGMRDDFSAALLEAFPHARADAARRADRRLDGFHDLLGYSQLQFDGDWHYDPVNRRRAAPVFFSRVPYLDPSQGDHKVIWELNRHQHWLAYGRAYWLTGDEKYRNAFIEELRTWLDANPPLIGINWASMLEIALRSLSWIWALHFFARPNGDRDRQPWTVDLLLALDRQLTHIEQNLSLYFSPNTHLLGEALALYVGGMAVPELADSRRRAQLGLRLLIAEGSRQIAPDGFHCERSTHYHRYTLDFYLLALAIARITRDPMAAALERLVVRLAAAARSVVGDNGRAPHLGDDDGGLLFPIAGRDADDWRDTLATAAVLTGTQALRIGGDAEETIWMTRHAAATGALAAAHGQSHSVPVHAAPGGSTALPDTGYYISRSAGGDHLVVDGGPHGYRNAGHAHADALSMTLSVRGRPLLIDAGTACYTIDPVLRDRFRSTAAHNTLLLDGQPQSQAAGPFHWLRTADAVTHRWRAAGAFDYFDGSHDGYAPVRHRRRVLALHGEAVIVVDAVEGTGRHTAAVHWHLGNEWTAAARNRAVDLAAGSDRARLLVPQGSIEMFTGDPETGLGWHSPVYGRVEPTTTVRILHSAAAPFTLVTVFDLNPLDPILDVEWLPVWAEAGTVAMSSALKLQRTEATDYASFVERGAGATPHPLWRIAGMETDAHMLCWRQARTGETSRVAMVDGSFVRGTGKRSLGITLGRVVPAIVIDESTLRNFTPCAALPGL